MKGSNAKQFHDSYMVVVMNNNKFTEQRPNIGFIKVFPYK